MNCILQCLLVGRRLLGLLACLCLVPSLWAEGGALSSAFKDHCTKCHGEKGKVKGKVNLLELKDDSALLANPDLIHDLIEVLDQQDMPPEEEPTLEPALRSRMISELKDLLQRALSGGSYAHTPVRRMNRFQYNNAVQDLFELTPVVFTLPERMLREYGYFKPETGRMPNQVKAGSRPLGKSQLIEKRLAGVAPFPQDLRAEHGYDNRGDHLSLSPLLMESFLQLSRSIVESDDFNPKTCGIWNRFFREPEAVSGKEIRDRLRPFLTRAFRRPVDVDTLDRYVGHAMARLEDGTGFIDVMKEVASAALASPKFLYLYDEAGQETSVPVDDFDLASRLSFFLWGSIPDETLLKIAAKGRLTEPAVLSNQVDRMLNDPRLKRFCDSFPSQWLELERIIASVPDPQMNPEFYFAKYRVSMHMMLEPLLVFETILVENRPILELVDSKFSYRSELLKEWYRSGGQSRRIPPTAIPFERVEIKDRREGGVITTAAVMTMTSNPIRTQPITRGAWMASVIFNDPPKPPPADVPPLPEKGKVDENLTLRERLDQHRSRPDCAGCHAQIDPLGFALENYGPTGIWRDQYSNGREVDVSGRLFRKHSFSNVIEFKDAILAEKDRFAAAFSSHLLSFALGRELDAADRPAVERIVAETADDDFPIKDVIRQVVLSEPFLYKTAPKRQVAHAE